MKISEQIIEEVETFMELSSLSFESIDLDTNLKKDLKLSETQIKSIIDNIEFRCEVSLKKSNICKQYKTIEDIYNQVSLEV